MHFVHAQQKYLGTTIYLCLGHEEKKNIATIEEKIFDEASRIEKKFSRFLPDSQLSQLNKNCTTWQTIDTEFFELLKFSEQIQIQTDNFLDPTTHDILKSWGYDDEYSLTESGEEQQTGTIQLDEKKCSVQISAPIDFGSFGKGFFLDQAKKIFEEYGCKNFLLNAGGDLVAQGRDKKKSPWKIFFEDPRNIKRAIGEAEISGLFACSSSPARRAWKNFHHLVHPQKKIPANDMKAVYVQSSFSGKFCDAMSTALFVMGFSTAKNFLRSDTKKFSEVEALLIGSNGKIWKTKKFVGEIYLV